MATTPDDFTNTISTSGTLKVGSNAKGNFEVSGDADWFAVDLVAGQRYVFSLGIGVYGSSYPFYGLALYDASGLLVSEMVSGASFSGLPALDFTASTSGTYYLAASASTYAGPGAYTVSATAHPGGDDFSANTNTTGALAADGTASGKFETNGDHDWFKFSASANNHYTIGSQTSGVHPSSFRIFDAAGKLVDDTGYAFDPASEGVYYLDVLGLAAGSYTAVLKEYKDDFPDNNTGAAIVLPGTTFNASINYEGDRDRVHVQLEAQKFYTFTFSGDFGFLDLNLTDAAGKVVAGWTASSYNSTAALRLDQAGSYYLSVGRQGTSSGFSAAVPYSIQLSTGVADDIGDTPATALQAVVDLPAKGTLQAINDTDVFKVTLKAGTSYGFALTADNGTKQALTLALSGQDGKLIHKADAFTAGYITFTPTQSGEYYAAVGAVGTPINLAYSLNINKPADDAGAAVDNRATLAIGGSKVGTLEAGGGDIDWYAVDLTVGQTYWFSAKGDGGYTLSNSGQLRLLDASGSAVAKTISVSGSTFVDTLAYVPATSGTYLLEVTTINRASGTYTVSAALGERDDFGSTMQTSGTLGPATPITGRLELGTDKDMFKINVSAGMVYGLTLSALANGSMPNLSLDDANGKYVALHDSAYVNGEWTYLFTAPSTGSLYATLQSYSFSPVSYKLRETLFAVDDYSASKDTTGALPIGATATGTLSHPGDVDWLRVKLESGKSYVFQLLGSNSAGGTLAPSSSSFYSVSNYFSVNNELGYGQTPTVTVLSSAVEPRLAVMAPVSGDYYVRLGSGANSPLLGTYTLRATQVSGDTSGPALVAQSHQPNAKDVALTATTITLFFNEAVTIDKTAIVVKDSQGKALTFTQDYGVTPSVSTPYVNDNKVVLKLSGMYAPGTYTVQLPHAAVHDLAGNAHTGAESFSFTTVLPVTAGTPAADLFLGGAAATINGGAGVDTVLYQGQYTISYTIKRTATETTVQSRFDNKTDVLSNVERLMFQNSVYALDIDGNAGQAYRLYQAALNRTPDRVGLGFWIDALDHGVNLRSVARSFIDSSEFATLYGKAPSDAEFITLLYKNVLHRTPDADGYKYWTDELRAGADRAGVLEGFSESKENVAQLVGTIGNGFEYTQYVA
jgi:hypothetical protein